MSSVRVKGITDYGRVFYSRASTFELGKKALENWAKNPSLGFGTGGCRVQPSALHFVEFIQVEEDPGHGPEVDLSPASLQKRK
jgi:hypothetical protein